MVTNFEKYETKVTNTATNDNILNKNDQIENRRVTIGDWMAIRRVRSNQKTSCSFLNRIYEG